MFRNIDALPSEAKETYIELQSLLKGLMGRDLPESTIQFINIKIEEFNRFRGPEKERAKKLKTVKNEVLKHLEKDQNLVPANYYTTLWMPLGMSAFGLPLGVVVFAITNNPAFIAVGLPIGLGLGGVYGAQLDKKAEKEGRVLKFKEKK